MRFGLALLLVVAACSDDAVCIEVDVACDRLYEPTFDNVFTMTLNDKCALSGCHDAQRRAGGVVYEDPDEAFSFLVDDGRVEPGNAGCSLLIRRIDATSASFRMPPGNTPLSEQERCSIRQWVENGAQR